MGRPAALLPPSGTPGTRCTYAEHNQKFAACGIMWPQLIAVAEACCCCCCDGWVDQVHGQAVSIEGERGDEWLVVDGGSAGVVLSLFSHEARTNYDLDRLWGR